MKINLLQQAKHNIYIYSMYARLETETTETDLTISFSDSERPNYGNTGVVSYSTFSIHAGNCEKNK